MYSKITFIRDVIFSLLKNTYLQPPSNDYAQQNNDGIYLVPKNIRPDRRCWLLVFVGSPVHHISYAYSRSSSSTLHYYTHTENRKLCVQSVRIDVRTV